MNRLLEEQGQAQSTASLPSLTYEDLASALEMIASSDCHRRMIPFLVSGLERQAPFLTGRLILFEILRSANCLADLPAPGPSVN